MSLIDAMDDAFGTVVLDEVETRLPEQLRPAGHGQRVRPTAIGDVG
jgi:hypothetical protein